MLSVLIPVYNYDVTALVNELHRQLIEALVDFEIIVMEDGSTLCLEKNREVGQLSNCVYICLESNIGRSAIRNKLADTARYDHLLFLDCDAEVDNEFFIQKYLSFCHEDCVVIGGTAYDEKENNPSYSLRLKYGREREARSAKDRSKSRYKVFTTFNFLISKSIFKRIRFDESIRGYGYEDTVFAHSLVELGYEVLHIENPLIHKGLDENTVFLKKTENGLNNLYALFLTGHYPFLIHESKLLYSFLCLRRWKLDRMGAWAYKCLAPALRRNLLSATPSLRAFDIYKLLFLCHCSRK